MPIRTGVPVHHIHWSCPHAHTEHFAQRFCFFIGTCQGAGDVPTTTDAALAARIPLRRARGTHARHTPAISSRRRSRCGLTVSTRSTRWRKRASIAVCRSGPRSRLHLASKKLTQTCTRPVDPAVALRVHENPGGASARPVPWARSTARRVYSVNNLTHFVRVRFILGP